MKELRLRKQALAIFHAALKAADPEQAVVRALRGRDRKAFRKIWVVGAGKAGASMARAAEKVLGGRIAGGLVNVKDGHTAAVRRIVLNECGHPVPDERGVDGAPAASRRSLRPLRPTIWCCASSRAALPP